jgi:hypothetical protein
MMSAELIRHISDEAAYKASREHKTPLVIFDALFAADDLPHVPFLGSYVPTGWRVASWDELPMPRNVWLSANDRSAYFMVDASGWGNHGEPALTFDEFVKYVQDVYGLDRRTLGLAIIEQGQFQVIVQWYVKQ